MKKTMLLLIGIVALAFFLRIIFLGSVPPSPDWDEASLGYNAYAILQTGRDEYGKFLPIIFRSFDDYKPGFYVYLVIPSIMTFGLNTFAVRFPSALFGTISVLATYFLVKEIFINSKLETRNSKQIQNANDQNQKRWQMENGKWKIDTLALLSSFLLAISPWSLQFSRIAFESNAGVAFNLLGVLFFLKGLKKHGYLLLSAFFMGANLSMYQSEKVFTPILVFVLLVVYRKEIFAIPKKYIALSIIVGLLAVAPSVQYFLTNQEAFARAKGVSVFADSTEFLKQNVKRLVVDKERGDILGLILDNRRVEFAKAVIYGYLSHFDLNWLFIHGDLPRHHAPDMGLLYLFELPFLLIGIYILFFGNFDNRAKLLLFLWMLIVPVPASVTSGVPHAVRTLNFLPGLQILTAIGLIASFTRISNFKFQISNFQIKYLIFSLSFLFFIFNFLYFLDQYFVQLNNYTSRDWQYGYEEAVKTVQNIEERYEKIIVSNKEPLDQSYIFFLFYLKYPPHEYQKEASYASGGFAENHIFGKYEFRPIEWDKERKDAGTLFVGRPQDFPESVPEIKKIRYLDRTDAIRIIAL